MKEVLGQILTELKTTNNRLGGLEQRQSSLEQGQSKLEQGQIKLEQGQSQLEEGQAKLEQGQSQLEQGQLRLEQGQQRIEKRLNAIFKQTVSLSEFRTETLQRLDNINVKFDILSSEMSKQKIDIELLKKRTV